ncbi:MAG: class I SAM-dependent methyltransferase [Pseudonocardiales bacterium]|nr:class I SAM-dependent methyltransferase [Pseudonocardiales bacterium]
MDETTSQHAGHGHGHRPFLPALGEHRGVRFYDAFGVVIGAPRLYAAVAATARAGGGADAVVVDVGCGSGALLRRVGRDRPDARLVGVDPDDRMLDTARRKAARSPHPAVRDSRWERGYAEEIPVGDGAADQVLSSLMFHHLDPAARTAMLAEVRRVLRPGGTLVLADFDGSRGLLRGAGPHSPMTAFGPGDLQALLADAGFAVRSASSVRLLIGGTAVLRAEPV